MFHFRKVFLLLSSLYLHKDVLWNTIVMVTVWLCDFETERLVCISKDKGIFDMAWALLLNDLVFITSEVQKRCVLLESILIQRIHLVVRIWKEFKWNTVWESEWYSQFSWRALYIIYTYCVTFELVKLSPEVTLCGWRGYKPSTNKLYTCVFLISSLGQFNSFSA